MREKKLLKKLRLSKDQPNSSTFEQDQSRSSKITQNKQQR